MSVEQSSCKRPFYLYLLIALMVWVLPIPAFAIPIVSSECKPDPIKCAKDGKLDAVEIFSEIRNEDYDFFKSLDEAIPQDAPFPKVYLDSEGGSASVGMFIGEILRKRKATVIGGSPFIPDKFIECSSACAFIAAGATTRQLNHIGIHQGHYFSYKGPKNWSITPVESDHTEKAVKYFIDMGIDPQIGEILRNTPHNSMADFFFDPSKPSEEQTITKLGFHMDGTSIDSVITKPDEFKSSLDLYRDRLRAAIDYGSIEAIYLLEREILTVRNGQTPDYKEAIKLLEIGASRDDPHSIHSLGYYALYGKGMKRDPKKSAQYYLRSAKLGMAGSQNNVGWAFYKGEGVPRSIPDAVYWITRSAEQGEPFAYGSLCEMYDAGDVFKRDKLEFYKWCRLAVDQEPEGKARDNDVHILEHLKKKMTPSEIIDGDKLVERWRPLKPTNTRMGDVEDD